ncbi:MAG: DUF5689 domain-containing protein [Bacteroidales bacterium]|jgi:hypothetical protein|nr:DUF5689 domain-containing protein [Bacteroidales bacterium]
MRTLKSILAVSILGMAMLFSGCNKGPDLDFFSITPSPVTLTTEGQTQDLKITIMPEDADVDFKWTSNNTAVVTVEQTGKLTATVKAIGNGSTTLTVKSGSESKTVNVTVTIGGGTDIDPSKDGDGSEASPYSIGQVFGFYEATGTLPKEIWVHGYIVGGVIEGTLGGDNGSSITGPEHVVFGTTGIRGTSVLIAASTDETDWTKVVAVELGLPANGFPADFRNDVSLLNHPENLKKPIKIKGNLARYYTIPGVRSITDYDIEVEAPPVGGFDLPEISIPDLQAMYSGSDVTLAGTQKIVGVVTSDIVGGNSTSLKNIIITATDNQSGMMIRLAGDNSSLNLGDKVEVKLQGTLTKYAGQFQLSLANANVVKVGTGTITPRVATIADITANISSYNYCVVITEGTLSGPSATYGNASQHQTNTLTDGGNTLDVFVSRYSTFVTTTMPTATVKVTGIAQVYGTEPVTNQIIIRNLNDVVLK